MTLLNTGRYCDREIKRRSGGYSTCKRRAQNTIRGLSGGRLDYCNKHIERAIKEYPQ